MQVNLSYTKPQATSAIVIPCYNEGKRLNVTQYLDGLSHFPSHVIFVDDGSKDNTFSILQKLKKTVPDRFSVIKCSENKGKAEAVRRGMLAALDDNFKHIGFLDADLATPFKEIPQFLKGFDDKKIKAVIGVRLKGQGRNIERTNLKFAIQKIIAMMGGAICGQNLSDTQCGAKMFDASALKPAIKKPFNVKWLFDQEILARFSKNLKTKNWLLQHPLSEWKDVKGSHVKGSDYIKCLKDYFKLLSIYGIKLK